MPEFKHTVVLCGPRGEPLLQKSECRNCRWHVEGKVPAVKIAEQAHHALIHQSSPAAQPQPHSRT